MALSEWLARRSRRAELKKTLAERIPPGQDLTEKWPVLHYGVIPPFNPYQWDFTVKGLVKGEGLRLSYKEFIALPRVTVQADMHCVTGWSKLDNVWEGVAFREIMQRVELQPQAKHVTIFSDGGYTTNLPLDVLVDDDVLFAYRHNGENLPPEHGWPLRLVVPKRYAWKSAKWVRGLELLAQDVRGFWERYGYHNNGDPWTEERYSWQEASHGYDPLAEERSLWPEGS